MSATPEVSYERIAMAGGEMPKQLPLPDQCYFLGLKLLYVMYNNGHISREEGSKLKLQMYREYENFSANWGFGAHWAKRFKDSELAISEYRKNRTLENADKIVNSISIGGIL